MFQRIASAARERTVEDLWHRIGNLLRQFNSRELANYFANSGYASI